MKIGIEAQRIFRKKKHGMEIVTIELIKHLQKIDTENEFVVFVKAGDDVCIGPSKNFKIIEVPGISYADWEQIQLPLAVKKEKVDLVHYTSNTASYFSNAPFVLTLHDIIYLESVNFSGTAYQNFGNLYRRLLVPKIVNKSLKIITVSKYEQARICNRFKMNQEKVQVVYNAKDECFKKITDELFLTNISQKYNLPADFILFLGNTAPKKNSKRLLEAYVHYVNHCENPLKLVVIDLSTTYIQEVLSDIGFPDHIKYIHIQDYIRHKDLSVIYNLATIFIYPSLRESFGLPIIEAMACGVPVITSNTSSMPEVANGAATLIDPFDVEDISNAFSKLTREKTYREDQIKKGYLNAEKFSWSKSATEMLSIYESVLNLSNKVALL